MNKIEKIEGLNLSKLSDLLKILLEKEGYEKIQNKKDDFLVAEIKRGFNNALTGFWLINKSLSGKVENQNKFLKELENFNNDGDFQDLVVVSNKTISNGFKEKINKILARDIVFLDRDFLIETIEGKLPHYWKQNDVELLEYESYYLKNVAKDNELKSLRGFSEKAMKLVDIYIKPRIYKIEEDKESDNPRLVKYEETRVLRVDVPSIIVGDAGAGKTTFLKKLGELCILDKEHKNKLPIFISTIDLIESHYDVEKAIDKNLNGYYEGKWREITYDLILLVDSIDEFEPEVQKRILKCLEKLNKENNVKYFLATRSLESNLFQMNCEKLEYFQIEKFNTKQIKAFISKFFQGSGRSQELIDALSENRILERLPMTPLSISLISILFEEKNLEIPATISDIYDNFNLLLLGKSTVNRRFEFVDINFKERILSLYALEILKRENKVPMTYDEFLDYFKSYFSTKSQSIPAGKVEEFLDFFISNTGVLYLKDKKYVQFKHDSFMEYYAALEIFKHKRTLEQELVDNFFDLNWQNAAIFFAGKSKDMPDFLEKILFKVENGQNIFEFNSGVMGLGYLLQALYQTDNNIRERGIIIALAKSIEALDVYKKIASDKEIVPFRDLRLPILTMLNLFFFIENFKSITLRDPLKMSFNRVYKELLKNPDDITIGYKALKLAIVLNSKRIGSEDELQKLIFKSSILNKPLLALLADLSTDLFDRNNDKLLKREIKKSVKKYDEINRELLSLPLNSIRFTAFDQIYSDKKLKIFTEGKTDAEIIEQAFIVLTNGLRPYWTLKSAGDISGGASEVRFLLDKSIPVFDDDEIAIGIFDNDYKGIQEFKGLKKDSYSCVDGSKRLKKHYSKSLYALKLPVPKFRENYIQEAPEHNYFAIEHYFSDSVLNEKNMLETTPIPGISKITKSSSKKSNFSSFVRTNHSPSFFKEFIILFKEIDRISGVEIEYIEE